MADHGAIGKLSLQFFSAPMPILFSNGLPLTMVATIDFIEAKFHPTFGVMDQGLKPIVIHAVVLNDNDLARFKLSPRPSRTGQFLTFH